MNNPSPQIFGFDIQSFILVANGLRPASRRAGITDIDAFTGLCKKYGLYTIQRTINYHPQNPPQTLVYIGINETTAKELEAAEISQNPYRFGQALGYPDCCIKEYIRKINENPSSLNELTLNASQDKLDWRLNNLHCIESKLAANSIDKEKFLKFQRISFIYDIFLINHLPCTFHCAESIKLADKTRQLMQKDYKESLKKIESLLKMPLLYIDLLNWVYFDGSLENNIISYRKPMPYCSFLGDKFLASLKRGNEIRILDGNILEITKSGRLVSRQNLKQHKNQVRFIQFK